MMERWKRLENEKGNGEMVGVYGGEEMMALLHTRCGEIWMRLKDVDSPKNFQSEPLIEDEKMHRTVTPKSTINSIVLRCENMFLDF